jgi:hypothetical protein
MNNLDLVPADKASQLQNAADIQRIAHRQFHDVLCWHGREFSQHGRARNQCRVDIMASSRQAFGEIGEVFFAAADLAR